MSVLGAFRLMEWVERADENIEEWGIQHPETLFTAIDEELGETAQAYLEATYEDEPRAHVEEEIVDLGALVIQLLVSIENHPRSFHKLPTAEEVHRRD